MVFLMKKVEAVVGRTTARVICHALKEAGFSSFMLTNILGRGKMGHGIYVHSDRAAPMTNGEGLVLDKSKLELILDDKDVDKVISIIIQNAKDSPMGDGKIFVSNVDQVIRIRTGDVGISAI